VTSDAGAELAREVFVVEIRTWSPNDRVSRSKRRLLVSKVVPWLFHTTEAPLRNRHCRYDTNPAPDLYLRASRTFEGASCCDQSKSAPVFERVPGMLQRCSSLPF